MAIKLKQHVELHGDDPLDAIIAGTTIKAWLVANFAMLNSVEEAVEQYNLSLAEIYSALAFYHDNAEAIRKANEEALQKLWDMGMKDMSELREKILRRQQKADE
jgi:hypothetical protein